MARSTGPSKRARDTVKARSTGVCERCGLFSGKEIHHRLSRQMGGTRRAAINYASNLVHLCSSCHRYVTEHPADAGGFGWVLRSWQSPLEVPVQLAAHGWSVLDDAGGFMPALPLAPTE